eukprot:7827222-Pyramimonas_sp.AAC.1
MAEPSSRLEPSSAGSQPYHLGVDDEGVTRWGAEERQPTRLSDRWSGTNGEQRGHNTDRTTAGSGWSNQ